MKNLILIFLVAFIYYAHPSAAMEPDYSGSAVMKSVSLDSSELKELDFVISSCEELQKSKIIENYAHIPHITPDHPATSTQANAEKLKEVTQEWVIYHLMGFSFAPAKPAHSRSPSPCSSCSISPAPSEALDPDYETRTENITET